MQRIPIQRIIYRNSTTTRHYQFNEKKEYKVKKVQNHRKQGYSTQFLVHWKSYGNEHNQ